MMLNTNPGGLGRYSDNSWARVAIERTPAISSLIGSSPNSLTVVRRTLL
jgi:hypothetical protein